MLQQWHGFQEKEQVNLPFSGKENQTAHKLASPTRQKTSRRDESARQIDERVKASGWRTGQQSERTFKAVRTEL